MLQQVQLPDVVNCTNIDCHEEKHINEIKNVDDNIIASLQQAGNSAFSNLGKHTFVSKPGWSDYIDDLYKASRGALSFALHEENIPMDKIPTTGFRCGCPDFLDLYMHAWFGPMVHVYIHTITMQSCLMHPTLLCCFILLLTETLILTIWCQSGICIPLN